MKADGWEGTRKICFPLKRTEHEDSQLDSRSSEPQKDQVPPQSFEGIIWTLAVSAITVNVFIMYLRKP